MWRLKMENLTIMAIIFSLVVYLLECAIVEGKTLDPIYWNSSNTLFRSTSPTSHRYINAAINDKLDIICPRKGRDDGEKLFYFKLYLVSEDNFRKCNATGGRRLITCDVPDQEKKYTFYFQEISPSPWGLEFVPEKSYFVVSTSDGKQMGMDGLKGGVCTRFNMKIEIKIHNAEDDKPETPSLSKPDVVKPPVISNVPDRPFGHENPKPAKPPHQITPLIDGDKNRQPAGDTGNHVNENGLMIGIILGACAVLFIVLLGFLGYKLYKRRRHQKKYQSPPMTPTRGTTPLQQVTLLPISPTSHHGHHHHGRLHSDHERHRSATLSSHSDLRPPPSYNESFLDNGGPVVAV